MRATPRTSDCSRPRSTPSSSRTTCTSSRSGSRSACATGRRPTRSSQRVFLRLAKELADGKTYSRAVPRRRLERREVDGAGLRVGREGGRDAPRRLGSHRAGRASRSGRASRTSAALIADLPDRDREVLDLLHREGLSPAQVAERLGIDAERRRPGGPPRSSKGGGEACCLGPTSSSPSTRTRSPAASARARPTTSTAPAPRRTRSRACSRVLHKATARPSATAEDSALLAALAPARAAAARAAPPAGAEASGSRRLAARDARPAGAEPRPARRRLPRARDRPARPGRRRRERLERARGDAEGERARARPAGVRRRSRLRWPTELRPSISHLQVQRWQTTIRAPSETRSTASSAP